MSRGGKVPDAPLALRERLVGDMPDQVLEEERDDLFSAWRLFFERLTETYPVVMAFEDMQWADDSLLDFIEYLLDWSRSTPICVVTLARPELLERRPTWGAGRRSFTSLYLEPLSATAMAELLTGLVPGLPEEVRQQILDRAEGIPLYAVETVRMLLDRGALVQEGSVYRPTGTIEALEVPETLQALIAARLDGLPPEERRLLQGGAVLGKTFSKRALAALSGLGEAELEPLLASLARKEVLGVQADPRSPEHGQYGVARAFLETEQVREAGLDEAALLLVGKVLRDDLLELGACGCRLLLLHDPGAHPHHVRERPIGDTLAVGEATAAVPVRELGDTVEVLVELPGQARLADAGDARDRDQMGVALALAVVEQVLDQTQLTIAADERRLEALRFQGTAGAGDDAQGSPDRDEPDLALQLVHADVLVDDSRLGRAPGRLAHQDLARLGQGLDPRGGVDEIAGDHALALGADRDSGLAGQHRCPRAEATQADLVAERRDRCDQVERGPDGPLGVVLRRRGRAPDGHHRVADELLDGAPVEADQPPARIEIPRKKLTRVFGVATLRQAREADEVGEEHGDEPPLGNGGNGHPRGDPRRDLVCGGLGSERSPTLAAEAHSGLVRASTCGAGLRQRRRAASAELAPRSVLRAATCADRHLAEEPTPSRRGCLAAASLEVHDPTLSREDESAACPRAAESLLGALEEGGGVLVGIELRNGRRERKPADRRDG